MPDTYLNIVIDDKVKERLEKIADKEHRTLSGQLRLIIEQWLMQLQEK